MNTSRYRLEIPVEVYKALRGIAEEEETTIADLLRRATKLLLFARSIKDDPGARLLLEREGEVQEVIIDLV